MPKISYAGCPGLSWMILKCVSQPKIAKNSQKNPIWGVQGCSRLSMLVPPESSSAVLVMISSKSVSICNRTHARRAYSGKKITISYSGGTGTPLWCPRSRGISSPRGDQITSLETRYPRLPYDENPESISHLGLIRYRVMTPQTDRRTEFS